MSECPTEPFGMFVSAGRLFPLLLRVKGSVGAAEVDGVTRDDWRGEYGAYGHEFLDAGNHVVIEEVAEGDVVVCGAIWLCVDGTIFLGAVRGERPWDLLCLEVDREEFALVRTDVNTFARERGGREERPTVETDREELCARLGVERIKKRGVRSAEVNLAVRDRWRPDHPSAFVVEAPALFAVRSIDGVKI